MACFCSSGRSLISRSEPGQRSGSARCATFAISATISLSQGAFHLAAAVLLGQSVAFVVLLLALCQRDLNLRPALLEVHQRWDNGVAPLAHSADQPSDLFAM